MRTTCQILALVLILICPVFAADDIQVSTVIGQEFPGKYKHPCTFTELDNGDILLAYYGGSGEYEDDSKVWAMRLPKGESKWTTPVIIADTPFLGEGNPVVWQAPDGVVWLFYVQRHGNTWSDSRIRGKISTDGGHTWSDSFDITYEQGTMVQGLPIALRDGDYLLPAYFETGHDREATAPDTASFFIRIDPKKGTWTETNRIHSKYGNLQPSPVQIDDNYLVAYCRRGGSFDPIPDGRLVRTESRDGGKTWSEGTESQFKNPNAACSFIRLKNGHLVLVYNDSIVDRNPLTVSISTDNDKTYAYKRDIAQGPVETTTFAYPVAQQTKDGKIHVICTTETRSKILHFVFDEEAILSHKAEQ
ncbi:MAG: exo-alpha-sialidase [Candidatus Hydrogenedentes bacterium]|nr:exo-alpha-sialidase [Candidatus Hydrogenedentota bacterium]